MPAYLFEIELPPFSEELIASIPMHRLHVDKLFSNGKMLSYSVSLKRDRIWCVLDAEHEQEAMERVIAFPLYKFFIDVTCNPLLFHNVLPASLPAIVLN